MVKVTRAALRASKERRVRGDGEQRGQDGATLLPPGRVTRWAADLCDRRLCCSSERISRIIVLLTPRRTAAGARRATHGTFTTGCYGGEGFYIRTGTDYPFNRTEAWAPTIWAFQLMALKGEMPRSFEQIEHKNDAYLAGVYSIRKNEGRPVRPADVPEDWRAPVDLPNRPTEHTADLFRKAFGEA